MVVPKEEPTIQQALNELSQQIRIRPRYDNFIGGQWVAPVKGQYFDNRTPVTGKLAVRRSPAPPPSDIELALDAAHKAKDAWGKTSAAERAAHAEQDRRQDGEPTSSCWPLVETLDNGKPIRETTHADMPLAVDHFRYFAERASAPRKARSPRSTTTRWPITSTSRSASSARSSPGTSRSLMAAWKLAPALAAGNCVVLKPAEQTPVLGIMVLMDLIGDILPPGVVNVVNGFGVEAGKPLASEQAHRQDRLHRRDDDRPPHHAVRLRQHHPGDAGARRQVAEHLLRRRDADADDEFFDKALEGFAMFALNQGEVCTCPRVRWCRRRSTTSSWSAPSRA